MEFAAGLIKGGQEERIMDMDRLRGYVGRNVTVWAAGPSVLPFTGSLKSVDDYKSVTITMRSSGERTFNFVDNKTAIITVTNMIGEAIFHNPSINKWNYKVRTNVEVEGLKSEIYKAQRQR